MVYIFSLLEAFVPWWTSVECRHVLVCPKHPQKCLLRLGTVEGCSGTFQSLEAGCVFADEWFAQHTSATYIINVFVTSWFVPSNAQDKSTRSAARSDVAGAFIRAESATLRLSSCTGHSFHFTVSGLPSESKDGSRLVEFFGTVHSEGQIIFSPFSLWFLLHNPAKQRDSAPEWRGGITQVCFWTIMIWKTLLSFPIMYSPCKNAMGKHSLCPKRMLHDDLSAPICSPYQEERLR